MTVYRIENFDLNIDKIEDDEKNLLIFEVIFDSKYDLRDDLQDELNEEILDLFISKMVN